MHAGIMREFGRRGLVPAEVAAGSTAGWVDCCAWRASALILARRHGSQVGTDRAPQIIGADGAGVRNRTGRGKAWFGGRRSVGRPRRRAGSDWEDLGATTLLDLRRTGSECPLTAGPQDRRAEMGPRRAHAAMPLVGVGGDRPTGTSSIRGLNPLG